MAMSVDNLKANLGNAQRTYLWEVIIPNPLGGGDSKAFSLRCQSASVPGRTISPIHIDYKQGPGFNIPGKNKYDQSWTVTVIEGEDSRMHDFLYKWMQNIVNDTSELGFGDMFVKRDIYFKLISTKGKETLKLKLMGAWPSSVPEVPVAMNTEDVLRYTVTFSFDKWVEV